MFLYNGSTTPTAGANLEMSEEMTAKWSKWLKAHEDVLVDAGAPFGENSRVYAGGKTSIASTLTGYSIVEADSLEMALELTDDHPFLDTTNDALSIEVFELNPLESEEI